MITESQSDQQDSSIVESGEGVGRRLRAARLERGLSLERIATQLHLKPVLLDALEEGRYAELPDPVFILGYIRNYARHIGLDPEPLLAAYRAATGHPEPQRPPAPRRQVGARRSGGLGRWLVRLMTVVVVVGLGYLFAQWWQNRAPMVTDLFGGSATDPVRAPMAQESITDISSDDPVVYASEPVADPPAIEQALIEPVSNQDIKAPMGNERPAPDPGPLGIARVPPIEPPAVTRTEPPVETPPAEQAAVTPVGAGETTTTDATEPLTAAGDEDVAVAEAPAPGEVVLEFQGACWVSVSDATKTFSLTGQLGKGDRRVLGGTPPYTMVLGNASAVTLTVKGQPFDLTKIAKGNVARFKLDPEQLP